MEWALVFLLGLFVFIILLIVLTSFLNEDEAFGWSIGITLIFFVWFTFGLEIGSGNLLEIKNGKVVDSKRSTVFAWDAPEYTTGVQKITPIVHMGGFKKQFTVYFRIEDENLESMQKHYDKFILPEKSTGDVQKEISRVLQKIGNDDISFMREKTTYLLYEYGYKVIGFE